jgi:hypothetical protein
MVLVMGVGITEAGGGGRRRVLLFDGCRRGVAVAPETGPHGRMERGVVAHHLAGVAGTFLKQI